MLAWSVNVNLYQQWTISKLIMVRCMGINFNGWYWCYEIAQAIRSKIRLKDGWTVTQEFGKLYQEDYWALGLVKWKRFSCLEFVSRNLPSCLASKRRNHSGVGKVIEQLLAREVVLPVWEKVCALTSTLTFDIWFGYPRNRGMILLTLSLLSIVSNSSRLILLIFRRFGRSSAISDESCEDSA